MTERNDGMFTPLKDLRPAVLEYLGVPCVDEGESLDESWENAYGDERDSAYRTVVTDYWRQSTDRHVVVLTAKKFHPHTQRKIILLIAETVAHWVGEPLQKLVAREIAYLKSGVAWTGPCWDALETERSDTIMIQRTLRTAAKWDVIECCVRNNQRFVVGDILAAAVELAVRSFGPGNLSATDAEAMIIGPDGPLKCLIETPEFTDSKLLLTRWEASVDVARKLFLTP